jgi:lipopolysaccharide export system permease protein
VKILDKYLLKTFLITFTTVFVILFFIFILQTIWLFISELAGKDLDLMMIIKFLLFAMPRIVPLVLPLTVLLASIMTFGDLSENYEFAAMKSAGISLQRAMRSLIIFITILSIVAFFFANNVIPYAEFKFISFRKNIAQAKPALAIAEGQFSDVGTYSIKVNKKRGENGNQLEGITIHQKAIYGEGDKMVIKAKNGLLASSEKSSILQLVLYDGYYYEDITPKNYDDRPKVPFAKSAFKKYIINLDLGKLNKVDMNSQSQSSSNTMLGISDLSYSLDSLRKSMKTDIISFSENINQKIAIPKKAIKKTETKLKKNPDDILILFDDNKKLSILGIASSNISSTMFTIDNSKIELENKQKNINEYVLAFYEKFVLAFACFLMFFIGAPLGAIIRKGGLGLPIVFAVAIFITFHFINVFGKRISQEDGMSPFMGSWMSTFILLPLAVLLTYRATNDIGLINFDVILDPLQKLLEKIKTKTKTTVSQPIIALENYIIIEDEEWRKLKEQSNEVLISVVKNTKQFNYSQDYRTKALKVLDDRGISQQKLLETNDLNNLEFQNLEVQLNSYYFYARITFFLYLIGMVGSLVYSNNRGSVFIIILELIVIILFYTSLYFSQKKLQDIEVILNRKIEPGITISFLVGFPFFIFLYLHNYKMLKEAIAAYK